MPANRPVVFPMLVRAADQRLTPAHLTEHFVADLVVGYTPGPPFGRRLFTREDLARSGGHPRELHREAAANLQAALGRVAIHGQPPALMLSFEGWEGLESSVLLAHGFWNDLAGSVPGELVVGAPARDVVIFTGSRSGSGLRKLHRAVDRVLFAGGADLLSRELLVRRGGHWEVFPAEPGPAPASPVPTSPAVMVPRPRRPRSDLPAR